MNHENVKFGGLMWFWCIQSKIHDMVYIRVQVSLSAYEGVISLLLDPVFEGQNINLFLIG